MRATAMSFLFQMMIIKFYLFVVGSIGDRQRVRETGNRRGRRKDDWKEAEGHLLRDCRISLWQSLRMYWRRRARRGRRLPSDGARCAISDFRCGSLAACPSVVREGRQIASASCARSNGGWWRWRDAHPIRRHPSRHPLPACLCPPAEKRQGRLGRRHLHQYVLVLQREGERCTRAEQAIANGFGYGYRTLRN